MHAEYCNISLSKYMTKASERKGGGGAILQSYM